MTDDGAFSALVGEELSGVVFVRDYVQLQFDGVTLSALTQLHVQDGDRGASSGDESFANLLIRRIGKTVVAAAAHPRQTLAVL